MYPKVLRVETGFSPLKDIENPWWAEILDYQVYASTPHWWRGLEEKLRSDIILALRARKRAGQYDIIWADSEKVGIPPSFLGLQEPLVVVAHYPESRVRALFLRFIAVLGSAKGECFDGALGRIESSAASAMESCRDGLLK